MRGIWLAAVLVALATCGTASAAIAPKMRYQADGTVLSNTWHGPQLCAIVMLSAPPQCDGLDVIGWDWDAVEHSAQDGVSWGDYHVVGTWDGTRLTLTEPPRPAKPRPDRSGQTDFTTPCPTPAGGWRPVAREKATDRALDAALDRARELPGYAASWVDQAYLDEIDGYDSTDPRDAQRYANDPKRLVLNLQFTGDATARESAIRAVWGGALCLSRAPHSEAELQALQEKATKEIKGVLSARKDGRAGNVLIWVWVVRPELQREVDEKYGKGLVVLHGYLKPVRP
ncbi:hypothetical protein [Microtetraspora fusca]|uniref:Uncharacterized protein n=1 Tax=Microtetraspora fusca TaxID=1997 RepID=A0ABW6VI78_MICFU|nr:hypothetical protein [Microtetraspora fusca]